MKNKKQDEISVDIKEVYGTLSDDGRTKKVYANISWCGRQAKPEIRNITTTKSGEEIVTKGIAISDDEIEALIDAYQKKKDNEEKSKPVNFDAIFAKAPDILDKREDGSVTEDGFIILHSVTEGKHKK